METDTSDNKKTSLEEMSKDDVIKKYNNLLMIAKKAKQSKHGVSKFKSDQGLPPMSLQMAIRETLEELKKSKEKEVKLMSEVDALKEVVESFTEKQKNFAEMENRIKQSEEKNGELKGSLQKVEDKYALKIIECTKLEETLKRLSEKLSVLEEKYSDNLEKLEDFKENYARIDIESKIYRERLLMYEKAEKEKSMKSEKAEEYDKESAREKGEDEAVKENEKLGSILTEEEDFTVKLMEELNSLKKSLSEKTKEYDDISEALLREEREKLRLLEEISELKKFKQAKEKKDEEEGKNKLERALENLRIEHEKSLKLLNENIEWEKQEWEKQMTILLKNNKELEESIKKENHLREREKENLIKEMKKTQEDRVNSDMKDKEQLKKLLENTRMELDRKTHELNDFTDVLRKEKEKFGEMLEFEKDRAKENDEKLQSMLKTKSEECEKLKVEKEKLTKELQNRETELKRVTRVTDVNSLEEISGENEKLMKKIKDLEKLVSDLEKEREKSAESHSNDKRRDGVDPEELSNPDECKKGEEKVLQKSMMISVETETDWNTDCGGEQLDDNLEKENANLKEEMKILKNNYEESVGLVRKKLEELLSSFTKVKSLRNNFDKEFKNKLRAFQEEQNETRQNIEEIVLKYVGQLHNGNSELLTEMNDMNQVLKERGETISKLEQLNQNQRKELEEATSKISTQSSKLLEKNRKLEEMEEEIGKAKLEVENKHKAMREMEEEMWKMKNSDSQGEALSSSTFSKAEETARLTELEESFEERYSKLKIIAVKLKKKVTELQNQVEAERAKLTNAEAEHQSKVTGFQNQIKALRNIQKEYDGLQDVLDVEKKEKNMLKKMLESVKEELSGVKGELDETKSEREKFKSDRNSFEKIKKELTAHIGELKQTVEKQKSEQVQLLKQMEETRNQLTVKERQVEEEKEKLRATMAQLEEQKMDSKKHSVLELEIAAYEKTAEELKNKLDCKEKEVKEAEKGLENERKMRESKEEEILKLQMTVEESQIRIESFNGQLKRINEELNEQRVDIQRKIETIRQLEKAVEEKNFKMESLALDLEEITKEKYKGEEKSRNNEEKFCRQIHGLEERIISLQDVLGQREMELEELKKEFQAYKVRAQSVLRQSQKEINPSKQQNALEELEQLKSTSESYKTRLEESNKKIQKLTEENGSFQEEKKRLFGRVQELNGLVTELRDENQLLKETKQKENEEHAEALRMQKLHSDTLVQCFQRQIDDLESKHAAQIEDLKREQEKLHNLNPVYLMHPDPVKRSDGREISSRRKTSGSFLPVKSEKDALDVMMLEREECEGSESVSSNSPQNLTMIPLEQLLNDRDQCDESEVAKFNQDLTRLRSQLDKSENRIKHLTILLAEAESDSARLNQLNEVLKEEIRRHQRSLEREKHAQNLEYLKNVFLKFVSLQNVDERLRLVPVLNTILKLSPEEEVNLTNCARGIHETGNRRWGNYLSIWPTG